MVSSAERVVIVGISHKEAALPINAFTEKESTCWDPPSALVAPQAIKRFGEPEEVGAAVAFLCSDKAAFITGIAMPIDGGYLTYSSSIPEADPAEGT